MYLRLRLKNWRSIDEAEVEFAPFTVIVGKNSSGKSNIVDALLFSSEVARDAVTAVSRRGGISSIRRAGKSKPFDVTIDLRSAASQEALDTDFTRHEMILKSGKDGGWRFHKETIEIVENGKPRVRYDRLGGQLGRLDPDGTQEVTTLEDTTSAMLYARQLGGPMFRGARSLPAVRALRPVPEKIRQPQPPTELFRLTESADNIGSALSRLREDTTLIEAMSRIVPGLTRIDANSVGRYISLLFTQDQGSGQQTEFAATEMSDGALRALAVIVAALQIRRNELLVIEEPEVNLHPGAAKVVYDVLHEASQRGGSIVVTTHSPELLDSARDEAILVCEYVDGLTKIGPLAEEQVRLVREGLFSTAELMRSDDLRRAGAPPRLVTDSD